MTGQTPRCYALVPSAGSGSRAATSLPKQYTLVAGLPMVLHTLAALGAVARIAHTLVVVAPGDDTLNATTARANANSDAGAAACTVADCGGMTRAHSVLAGLGALQGLGATAQDWVLVHDAARCLVTPAQIDALIDACLPDAVGGLLALPLPDTLKAADAASRVATTVDRADKWLAQTPQMFRIGPLQQALAARAVGGFAGITDEASAMEAAGHRPLLVRGSAQNFKVTYPEDFALAEAVLTTRRKT